MSIRSDISILRCKIHQNSVNQLDFTQLLWSKLNKEMQDIKKINDDTDSKINLIE